MLKLHLSLPRLIFAFALIVVGAAYLFQALGMMPHPVIYYGYHYGWALGFLVFGLWQIPRSFLACLLYLALSAVFFLRGAGYLHYSLMTYALDDGWPICLFVFGVWLAGKSIKNAIFRREFGGLLLFLFGLIDAGIGAGLLLDQFHIIVFNYGRFYELVWPVALMIFGVSFLFGGRVGRRRVARKKENHESFTDEEPEGAIVGLYRHEQAISQDFKRPMKKEGFLIGDFKLGGSEAWTFEDTSVWHAIGDVGVDLRQAVFDERESQLIIRGLIGDVKVVVPPTLSVRIYAELSIGDIRLFSTEQSGLGRKASFVSPGYDESERKLDIYIALKVGDVGVSKG